MNSCDFADKSAKYRPKPGKYIYQHHQTCCIHMEKHHTDQKNPCDHACRSNGIQHRGEGLLAHKFQLCIFSRTTDFFKKMCVLFLYPIASYFLYAAQLTVQLRIHYPVDTDHFIAIMFGFLHQMPEYPCEATAKNQHQNCYRQAQPQRDSQGYKSGDSR